MLRFASFLLRFYGKDCKTGLTKIVAHLTNSNPCKKRFSNRPIRFPGSNLDSGEITGNAIGSARSKDLTAWARGLSPTNTTGSDAPHRWRARRPLASRVFFLRQKQNSPISSHARLASCKECFHISNRPLPIRVHSHEISKFLDTET